jgi:hypothetical protein
VSPVKYELGFISQKTAFFITAFGWFGFPMTSLYQCSIVIYHRAPEVDGFFLNSAHGWERG